MKKYIVLPLSLLIVFAININAQFEDFFEPKTTVGGYGELHYNYEKPEMGKSKKTLDFHRFVLFFSHSWSEKWSFKAEVELEHNFVSDGEGELELEQAYVNYHHSDWFGFQAGVVLPSVGLINENHEPPLFLSVERPVYHNVIIPTTWFGNGAAVYGNLNGFDYKITIMEGLNADKFKASSGIRSGRQKGFKANAENLLYNFRLDYLDIPGLKIGASFTYNKAMGDSIDIPLTLIEGHSLYTGNNVFAAVEFGMINFENGEIEKSLGYYFDLGYNVGSFFDCETEIIPFFRWSQYNPAHSTISGGNSEKQYSFSKWMVGISLKPLPQIVFKADYSQPERELDHIKTDQFNLGIGYFF